MPEPDPAPTSEQLVIVAEITMLPVATVSTMIAADGDQEISDAKWARTLTDIAAWSGIRDKSRTLRRVGSIEFFEGERVRTRLDFRNRIRTRYGQLPLASENQAAASTENSSVAVSVGMDF